MASGLIPPPPGVTANFVDPPSQLQSNIALHTICLTLVTIAVGMRFYTRLFITKSGLGLDDAFCALSYLFTVTFSGLMLKCYTLGIGRHMWDVTMPSFMAAVRIFTFAQYIYILLALFIRLTFLIFYYRLFSLPSPKYKYTLHGVMTFVVTMNLALFFATLFNCNPREKNWDPTVPGSCIPPSILPWFSGASSSLTDLVVLIIPIPILSGMNMAFNKKVRAMAVFGLGIFVCIASIVRMAMTKVLYVDPDRTWNISTIAIWATLEVNLGIICSCLMFLPAFFERYLPESTKTYLSRLWDSALNAIGKKTTPGSTTQLGTSWPRHIQTHSATAPVVEIKHGSSSQLSMMQIHVHGKNDTSSTFGRGEDGGEEDLTYPFPVQPPT
ncbi:putative integral membrane protein Pth11-like [Rhypophila decipiens]|uniref:Integral membrane protein Pth11-like n=1 Tax=Rhypophila decipiens TaxID=261697 RepID=A0AAN6Y5C9_9PEZI|nr:putative integral membrane protein Pth11-like [Rhypophila decipiens]